MNRLEWTCINASKTGLTFILVDKNSASFVVFLEGIVVTRFNAFASLALATDNDTLL